MASITQRVIRVRPEHSKHQWRQDLHRDRGLHHLLVPAWAKDLWGHETESGLGLVPHRKFFNQPYYHSGESYVMSLLAQRIEALSWEELDGTETAAPEWACQHHESLTECFQLFSGLPQSQPRPGLVQQYGEVVLNDAFAPIDGHPVGVWMRNLRDTLADARISLTDLDVIALPSDGGSPRFIEVKADDDSIKQTQVDTCAVLSSLGATAEVWWVLSPKKQPDRSTSLVSDNFDSSLLPDAVLAVQSDVAWDDTRSRALASVLAKRRSSACDCSEFLGCISQAPLRAKVQVDASSQQETKAEVVKVQRPANESLRREFFDAAEELDSQSRETMRRVCDDAQALGFGLRWGGGKSPSFLLGVPTVSSSYVLGVYANGQLYLRFRSLSDEVAQSLRSSLRELENISFTDTTEPLIKNWLPHASEILEITARALSLLQS